MPDAIASVERSFVAFDRGVARTYSKVCGPLRQFGAVFGVDSGFDASARVLGLKTGGCWPDNSRVGLANHQSTIALFDPKTGRPAGEWVRPGTHVSAMGADAVGKQELGRP